MIFGIKFNGTAGLKLPWNGDFASMQFMDKRVYYYIILAILIITILISYKISKSRPGYYFKAINTNQMAASSLGVSVLKYKMYAQVLTAFIMGVIGGFYVMYITAIEPISMFSFEIVFNILLFAIVGGRANCVRAGYRCSDTYACVQRNKVFRRLCASWTANGAVRNNPGNIRYVFAGRIGSVYKREGLMQGVLKLNQKRRTLRISEVNQMTEKKEVLRADNIVKMYGGLCAIDDSTIYLKENEVLGLIGPNGAGKTTMFNMISGTVPLTSGKIYVHGKYIKKPKAHIMSKLGHRTYISGRTAIHEPNGSGEYDGWCVPKHDKS